MNTKRYYELFRGGNQSLEVNRALPGHKDERDTAKEIHDLLRNYTYQLIGLGNCFRRIAGDFAGNHGSNWRNNRYVSERIKSIILPLYSMDPCDTDAILKIEKALEELAIELSQRGDK